MASKATLCTNAQIGNHGPRPPTLKKSETTTVAAVKTPSPAEIARLLTQFSTTNREEFVKSMRELGENVGFQEV